MARDTKKNSEMVADLVAKNFRFAKRLNTNSEYGHLYEGVWGGVPSVLKLEPIDAHSNEAEKAKIVMQARESAGKLADYLPRIWKTGQIDSGFGSSFSYIVMEKLDPLPADLSNELFATLSHRATIDPKSIYDVFLRKDTIRANAAQYVNMRYVEDKAQKNTDKHLFIETAMQAIFLAALDLEDQDFDENKFKNLAQMKFKTYIAGPAKDLYYIYDSNWEIVLDTISGILEQRTLPQFKGLLHTLPQSGSVVDNAIKALQFLSEAGLHWSDVHEDNVLYRKSTKTPVFIDFGLYEIG